jgi:hypothetical protein
VRGKTEVALQTVADRCQVRLLRVSNFWRKLE